MVRGRGGQGEGGRFTYISPYTDTFVQKEQNGHLRPPQCPLSLGLVSDGPSV